MILVGISWLLYWALIDVFRVDSLKAALVTGIVFVVVALLLEHNPWPRRT